MIRKYCKPYNPMCEYIQVREDNKEDLLIFLAWWEVKDVVFSEDQEKRRIYTLIHNDPNYNAKDETECPWMCGYVEEYLLKYLGEYSIQDRPDQVRRETFEQFYHVLTEEQTKEGHEELVRFTDWYEKEGGAT